MPKIQYYFNDGTSCDVEVDDEFYNQYQLIEKKEKLVDRKETRRHESLNADIERGLQFSTADNDPTTSIFTQEDITAFNFLSPEQRELLEMVYIDGMTITAIAKQENVSQQAISKRLASIIKKIKKFL